MQRERESQGERGGKRDQKTVREEEERDHLTIRERR